MVVEELINPNAVICADELNKFEGSDWTLPLNVYLVSYDDVNWDEELIAPLKLVKNEPVSLSVIQLALTLSIAFNLFTKDDVDCDAVNVFKFEIDVTKLAVEILAVKVFKLLIEVTIDAVVTLAV